MQPITIASTRIYSTLDIELLIVAAVALAALAWVALGRLRHPRH